jgi:hypothetical protein
MSVASPLVEEVDENGIIRRPRGRPGVSRQSHRRLKYRIGCRVPTEAMKKIQEESNLTGTSDADIATMYLLRGMGLEQLAS